MPIALGLVARAQTPVSEIDRSSQRRCSRSQSHVTGVRVSYQRTLVELAFPPMRWNKVKSSNSDTPDVLDLSFLHCVYRQPQSASAAAQSLWSWYPHAVGVVVIDDGGIAPQHSTDPRVSTTKLNQRLSVTTNGLYLNEQTVDVFVDHVLEACAFGREWLFILEDDVRVLGPITSELEFDLNGFNPRVRLPRPINIELLKAMRRPLFRGYGGCGGALLRTTTLMKSPMSEVRRFLRRAIDVTGRPLGSDEVLSAWVLYNRGRLGSYEGFAETFYPDFPLLLESGRVAVLHQYKDDYVRDTARDHDAG